MLNSNTGQNSPRQGQFHKCDPRINRKGRPKSFDALRELAQQIAHEEVKRDGEPVVINGHIVTAAELILRQWATSKNPQMQRSFLEIAFVKVPDNLDITTSGDIEILVKYATDSIDLPNAAR